MKVEQKIVAAFIVAAVAVALLGAMTYLNVRALFTRNVWVVHTYRVLGELDQLDDSISQMEGGAWGYLLTGMPSHLVPYQAALDASATQLSRLRTLTADNPVQGQHLIRLQTLLNRAVAGLHGQVEDRRTRGAQPLQPLFDLDEKENMDQLRFTMAAMRNVETRLLMERTASSNESSHRTQLNFGLLLALALALLLSFYVFIRHDLAERRRADLALRESDKKFRGVLESAPDAMFVTGSDGLIEMVNPQAEHLFGYPREELTGLRLSSLLYERTGNGPDAPAEEPGESGNVATNRALRDFRSAACQFDGVRKGGELFPIEVSRSRLELGAEHLTISAVRDRTERQKAEDALQKFSLDLGRSNAELERFAYVASHDLQEPLRMVSSYTQLLAKRYKGKLDSNADEFIGYAVDGATRMQKLINDLLALSRVGTQARPNEAVDTGEVMQRVLSDLKPAIEAAGATITVPDGMPVISADGTQIGQLFQNLIGNAIKFRGPDAPRVAVGVEPADDDKFRRFSFRDNGIGIDPQYFDRVFVIFQRLHSKEQYAGTGIGLAICKKIVERHGGRLWLESEPGAGANFLFTLPLAV